MTCYQWQAFAETQPDCMRDLVRTINDLVEDCIDDDSDPDGSYDSDDIVFYVVIACTIVL